MANRKILFVASNPKGGDPLRLRDEEKKIRDSWQLSKNRHEFDIQTCIAATVDDLRVSLSKERPNIVHFSGHGTSCGQLVMENESGTGCPVEPNSLSELFSIYKDIECVILNACYSDTQAQAIAQHVTYVIGTTDAVNDDAAALFSKVFYGSLCNGHDYEESYKLALTQLQSEGLLVVFQTVCHIRRKTRILMPLSSDVINPEVNTVEGVAGDDFASHVYLVSGGGSDKRYWPSYEGEIKADSLRKWRGKVHVGTNKGEAQISVIKVDKAGAEYIEFYRKYAASIKWPGFTLVHFQFETLDTITVKVNLMRLRTRLEGRYSEFDSQDKPTGKNVAITLIGEWAIKMICTSDGKPEWESVIMMDDGNPNVGKGVYTLSDGRIGHHYITYNPSDQSIRVDGYYFKGIEGKRWTAPNTLKRLE